MSLARHVLAGSLFVALAAAGCTGLGIPGPAGPLSHDGDLVSNNAGSLVSNHTGSLTGVFRAPAAIVSNNAGSLVSNNGGSYRIGALEATPVAGALVAAYDLAGEAIAGCEARTTADGRFAVPVPPDRPVVLRSSLAYSGRTYVFQGVGVAAEGATGSADLDAGTTLASESLLRIAALKGLDLGTLVAARLGALSAILGGAFGDDRIGVLSEGQAALVDYTTSLMASSADLKYVASVLNGYTGLSCFDGTLYLADNTRGTLLRLAGDGTFTPWLGGTGATFADGPAPSARFASVYGLARAADGTVYFADAGNHRIRRVGPSGEVSTLAGGTAGMADGIGTAARFRFPTSVALAGDALFVTDTGNNRLCRIDLASGAVTTPTLIEPGLLGSATNPPLWTPRSIVADPSGALYFIESSVSQIRRLTSNPDGTFQLETLAGNQANNVEQYSLLDGTGPNAAFFLPMAMAYHDQALYVADTMSHAIRRVDLAGPEHAVTTLAGGGPRFPGRADGTGPLARFRGPDSIAVAADGTVYVGDGGNLLLRAVSPGGEVRTLPVRLLEPRP